jgi:hypothetical protein
MLSPINSLGTYYNSAPRSTLAEQQSETVRILAFEINEATWQFNLADDWRNGLQPSQLGQTRQGAAITGTSTVDI